LSDPNTKYHGLGGWGVRFRAAGREGRGMGRRTYPLSDARRRRKRTSPDEETAGSATRALSSPIGNEDRARGRGEGNGEGMRKKMMPSPCGGICGLSAGSGRGG
jgi:hypothetical protein